VERPRNTNAVPPRITNKDNNTSPTIDAPVFAAYDLSTVSVEVAMSVSASEAVNSDDVTGVTLIEGSVDS